MRILNDITIFDDSNAAIENLGYLQISAQPTMRITQYPVEDGGVVTDSKIKNPTRVKVRCCVLDLDPTTQAWKQTYAALKKLHERKDYKKGTGGGLCSVQNGADVFRNLSLVGLPTTEDLNNVDTLVFDIEFQEVIIASKDGENCENTAMEEHHYSQKLGNVIAYNEVDEAVLRLNEQAVEDEVSEAVYTAVGIAEAAVVYASLVI